MWYSCQDFFCPPMFFIPVYEDYKQKKGSFRDSKPGTQQPFSCIVMASMFKAREGFLLSLVNLPIKLF